MWFLRFSHQSYLSPLPLLSNSNNLSWTSLGESVHDEALLDGGGTDKAQMVFGQSLSADDLEPVAVGVPREAYKATQPEEFSFEEGEPMRILASQAFVKEVGGGVKQEGRKRQNRFSLRKLVPQGLFAGAEDAQGPVRPGAQVYGGGARTRVWQLARHGRPRRLSGVQGKELQGQTERKQLIRFSSR